MTDPRPNRWLTLWPAALAVLIVLVFWFGRSSVNLDPDIAAGLISEADPLLAWPVALLVFLLGSFLGVPQFMLIAGAVIAFGPGEGAAVSWVATLISAMVHFYVGRIMGGDRLRKRLTPRLADWMDRLARNGTVASFTVRIVPTGPALFVNMAAGASGMRLRDFLAGTALGILPKIAIIALFGKGLGEWVSDNNALALILSILAILAIAAGLVWLRRRIRARRERADKNSPKGETSP